MYDMANAIQNKALAKRCSDGDWMEPGLSGEIWTVIGQKVLIN